jgi:hypothetical protein
MNHPDVQERAGWPVVTMVRFSEHVRKGNPVAEVEGPWHAKDPAAWGGPIGYETETYLPESAVTGLVGAAEEAIRAGETLRTYTHGRSEVRDVAEAKEQLERAQAALSSFKKEVG